MAITISGPTITGLNAGGLPANSVGTSALASGAVTQANLGAGTILQTTYLNSTTRTTHAPGNTLGEPSSSYRCSITPLYTNSIIKITYHVPWNMGGSWAVNYLVKFSAKRWIGGAGATDLSSVGVSNGSRWLMSGYADRPHNGYDVNDMNNWGCVLYDAPNTTSAVQYGFYAGTEGGTMYYGYSAYSGGGFAWDANIVITCQEIKQ